MSQKDDVPEDGAGQSLVDDPELKMPDATMYESEFWGIARHELIAGAAEEKLSSEKAKKEVRRILAPLGGMMLSDVAGWADTVKRRRPNPDQDDKETIAFLEDERNRSNHTWHYVNLPLDAKEYSREAYPEFTGDEDVVQIMSECIRVLQGQSDRFSELNALRLLAHMAGDIHQPAHVGCCYLDESSTPAKLVRDPQVAAQKQLESDQGGNRILLPLGSSGVSLHSYWDSRLGGTIKPEDFLDAEDTPADAAPEAPAGDSAAIDPQLRQKFIGKLAAMIDDQPPAGDAPAEADTAPPELWPEQWASESLVTARAAYKSLKIAEARGNKFIVSWEGKEAYEARCKPLVIQQMKLAAQNLAALLDEVLG
ncbi:MAG TPA: S1/P1 nuclease [Pyrinomonadaceae bacterium]|nr:S1/P1 nuclease [Pyrinomonadaceae bacterium]